MKRTYIPKLDDILGGGIVDNASVMFSAVPGVDCEAFGYQMLYGRLKEGDKGFIFTNVAEPETITYEFNSYGWDLEKFLESGDAFFVDGSSPFMGLPSTARYSVDDYSKIEEIVLEAISDVPGGIGVINNLSTLIDYLGEDETINIIKKWNLYSRRYNTNLIYLFTKWDYTPSLVQNLKKIMDCVVEIRTIEERVIIGQGFMVAHSSWSKPSKTMVLFFVVQPGGVKVYIPKILVTGPYNAGKSTFVKKISKRAVSVDRKALSAFPTTIALDIGHLEYKGFIADVFGTPGQERFDLLLDVLGRESVGAFIIVDSTAPQTFARAKEMIRKTRAEAIPKVLVANKQDLPGALSPEEIREKMKLGEEVPIIPAIVTEGKGVTDALDALLGLLYGD
ncbi:MAG TPA: ATPase domain-containing protein [Methanothermobacter sp.]|nr:small GTPase [Methanothermobacter sp. MT-2]HHW05062.1 GTP-binding protein [Methanothermobacter sp.]HOK72568.1 ATPase domain-containing protein [Methanothermobacter sp.]HOL69369.1 ATPase domain-containing protein [Methanothermobacter sp.]HPQ04055.1 ATPase domain-containing protein [Methanothermobacter sp.]